MKAPDHTLATLAQRDTFDAIIDVRSPAEYAEDHLPGAINCPVLDDAERIRIGTLYKQVSPFEARKAGAVLVARNIARHIESQFAGQPKSWRPLIYCWRGGQRSGAFTHVLREIGWSARRLEGGYKTWRHHVLEQLAVLPGGLRFQVILGPTGSAKSRVLEALARQGAQVLHLEALAAHKGSVLGGLPEAAQPAQKKFETDLYVTLAAFDPARPVYVEAESRRIGRLALPQSMVDGIAAARPLRIEAARAARVRFLLADYAYLCDAAVLNPLLERLRELLGKEVIGAWQALASGGAYATLVGELLDRHYDPLYTRSQRRVSPVGGDIPCFATDDLSAAGIEALAGAILAQTGQ